MTFSHYAHLSMPAARSTNLSSCARDSGLIDGQAFLRSVDAHTMHVDHIAFQSGPCCGTSSSKQRVCCFILYNGLFLLIHATACLGRAREEKRPKTKCPNVSALQSYTIINSAPTPGFAVPAAANVARAFLSPALVREKRNQTRADRQRELKREWSSVLRVPSGHIYLCNARQCDCLFVAPNAPLLLLLYYNTLGG